MNYCRDYVLIANFFVMMLLPFALISIMNTRMYKTIIQTSRRNFRQDGEISLLYLRLRYIGEIYTSPQSRARYFYCLIADCDGCGSRLTKRQRRDRKVAMLLLTVVIVFLSCNSIRIGLNTYEVRIQYKCNLSQLSQGMKRKARLIFILLVNVNTIYKVAHIRIRCIMYIRYLTTTNLKYFVQILLISLLHNILNHSLLLINILYMQALYFGKIFYNVQP